MVSRRASGSVHSTPESTSTADSSTYAESVDEAAEWANGLVARMDAQL